MTSLSVSKSAPVKQAAKKIFWETIDTHLKGIIDPSPINLDELAGFFDGDGSFYFTSQGHMSCAVTQCSYKTLRKIQDVFGGIIRKRNPKIEKNRGGKPENHRFQYTLVFRGIQAAGILPFIKDRLVEKSHTANIIMDMMKHYNENTNTASDARRELHAQMCNEYTPYYDRINWDYIRGIFEAEGCIQPCSLSICQKSDLNLLHAIKAYAEDVLNIKPLGVVNETCWITCKKANVTKIVDALRSGSMFHDEKTDQLNAFVDGKFDLVKTLKHVEEDVDQGAINEGNDRAKELAQKIRVAWHGSFNSYATRPAMHRQPVQFNERPPKLTEDQKRRVVHLRESGLTFKSIATELGCTKSQVQIALRNALKQKRIISS